MALFNTLPDLPDDMVMKIMLCVEADSIKDFIKIMKLCCTRFRALGETEYMLRSLSLHTLDCYSVYGYRGLFLQSCANSNNIEAPYRAGVNNYFGHNSQYAEGCEQLLAAVSANHLLATYTIAMILIFNWHGGVTMVEQDYEMLRKVTATGKERECRKKLNDFVGRCWPADSFANPPIPQLICRQTHWKVLHAWEQEYMVFLDPDCKDCRCDAEVERFHFNFEWNTSAWALFRQQAGR